MEKKYFKPPLILLIIFFCFAGNLFAQENADASKNEVQAAQEPQVNEEKTQSKKGFDLWETLWPFPIVSVDTGWPESFSLDLGLELLFHDINSGGGVAVRDGIYVLYNYAKGSDNKFYRVSAGYVWSCMFLEFRAGGGIGFMKENGDLLTTCFAEADARLFLLDVKLLYEIPLGNGYLKDYYRDNYFPLKFRIGISL